ncbi:MAG TPA: PAS domain-containing protein [Anaerolineae bacterium]|nr:PAS domain-containing protein [Anaerolineae bacterium]
MKDETARPDALTALQNEMVALKVALLQAQVLQAISRDISAARDEQQLLQALAQPGFDADACTVSLSYTVLDENGTPTYLETVASLNADTAQVSPVGMRMNWARHPLAEVLTNHPDKPLYIADARTDPHLSKAARAYLARFGVGAEVAIPLRHAGQWVGLIIFDWQTPHHFSDYERAIFDGISPLMTVAVQNRRLVDRLEKIVAARTAELHESQFLFQTFLDNFPDLAFARDLQGHFILSNRALEITFALRPGEAVGRTLHDFAPQEVADCLWTSQQDVLAQQGPVALEVTLPAPDDPLAPRVKYLVEFPLYDADNRVYAVGGVANDITDRKQAQAERERLQHEVIVTQQQALKELATPIIPIMKHPDGKGSILVMPLIGSIDALRAGDIMRALLAGISAHRAKVVILDMTGVPLVDTSIINYLNRTIQAARLKGAQTIITGISDVVAETIVDLGIDWSYATTLSDLHTGLIAALRVLGLRLSKF